MSPLHWPALAQNNDMQAAWPIILFRQYKQAKATFLPLQTVKTVIN